jgi:HEPN domain-containing protein
MTEPEQPSAAFQELMRFADQHSLATKLLRIAAHDYAAARCLLFNGMFEGLVLGAQAIEKCLKAYLIFDNPQRRERELHHHSLPKLLTEAGALFPQLSLPRFAPTVEKFRTHYQARYPDNPDASTTKSTAEMRQLDELLIFLNENMPCPRNAKYQAGIYPLITFSFNAERRATTWELWIKHDNEALIPLLPRINVEYLAVMEALHPQGVQSS